VTALPRIGVVGTGRWGRNLARNFAVLGALGALCDRDREVLAGVAGRFAGVAVHDDLEALLAAPGVDAVAIATPSATHAELARRVIEAGKPVFVEKPLCLSHAEALRLRTFARSRSVPVMVGHLLLYHPAFVALHQFVRSGRLGALGYLYAHRLGFRSVPPDGDALWDLAPHDVSMMLRLADAPASSVTSTGAATAVPAVADTQLCSIRFENGLHGHLFVSWVHPVKDHRLIASGGNGTVVFDDVLPGSKKLLYFPHAVMRDGVPTVINREEAVPLPYAEIEPLAAECRHFLDCITRGTEPLSGLDEAVAVLAVLDACGRALESGRAESVSGVGDPAVRILRR
jgi:UDP-2-acetamido-3-amino-2,3-dideoxy-glucuronate N-acetyltransferase